MSNLSSHFSCGGRWSIGFNHSTGAINHLVDKLGPRTWADPDHQLAEFTCQTFTGHDHNHVFMSEYMSLAELNPVLTGRLNPDFGKPGLNGTEHLDLRASLLGLWKADASNCSDGSRGSAGSFTTGRCSRFMLHLNMSDHAHRMYGAPRELWMHVDVPESGARFSITLGASPTQLPLTALMRHQLREAVSSLLLKPNLVDCSTDMFDKTPTRIVESSSMRFVPAPLSSSKLTMQVSKLGSWVDPADVALNGSRHLHGLDDTGGVGFFGPGHKLAARIIPVDGTTSCVGRYPTPYPTPLNEEFDSSAGFAANIHNNVWNTCYILFYPYLKEDSDLRQRYLLDLDGVSARSPLPWQAQPSISLHTDDDGASTLASRLNLLMAKGPNGSVYTGGTGVVVRDPFDGYENSTSKAVVPASLLVNDIIASGTVFPPCNDGEAWPDQVLANLVYVVGSEMTRILHDFESIQSESSNANVFYPADSNAADDRCRWLPERSGYDCPFGKFLPEHGEPIADARMQGSGSFDAGNREANSSWGGGAGCHFSAFDTGAHNLSINQVEAMDAEGRSLVEGRDCQCNTAYRRDPSGWDAWVENYIRNGSQLGAMNNPMDCFQCWTSNLRDMILLQNSIFRHRAAWATKGGTRKFTGDPAFGTGPHSYYGWNEIPVPRVISGQAANWDAVAVKLPPNACNQTTGGHSARGGRNDSVVCLGQVARLRLEANLDRWVAGGLLVPGAAALRSKPVDLSRWRVIVHDCKSSPSKDIVLWVASRLTSQLGRSLLYWYSLLVPHALPRPIVRREHQQIDYLLKSYHPWP